MRQSKNEIKDLISAILDELPLPEESGVELSPRKTVALENALRFSLADALRQMFVVRDVVVCMLQNNVQVIDKKNAVMCAGCNRYYCQKHKLTQCPHCGNGIP